MKTPIAVLQSDVHYSLSTLPLADKAFRMAIDKAAELEVDLIDCGDLTNDKANIRAEVANALIKTLQYAQDKEVLITCLVGNHSLINERGKPHALEFIKPYCHVIQEVCDGAIYFGENKVLCTFIPYQSNPEDFAKIIAGVSKGDIIIMHQGVSGSLSGEYVHDKSSIHKDLLKDHRVISGHYHTRQTIKCGPPRNDAVGFMDYVGNPYTLTFGEANDPVKGIQILYSDGTLEHVPTNLRKHVIVEKDALDIITVNSTFGGNTTWTHNINPGDLVWVKVRGPKLALAALSKDDIKNALSLHDNNFKLDKIATGAEDRDSIVTKPQTHNEIMDLLIDESSESTKDKATLKNLYRELMS